MDTLAKMLQNIFAYSFVSEHSKFFLFEIEIAFLAARGGGVGAPFNFNPTVKNTFFLLPSRDLTPLELFLVE